MQTIPGLVPTLQVGSFEGGQFNANGQATTGNLFLVDGQYDNDSRRGGSQGTQARVTLDSMAEYQVQTHQYGAEYGGSTGVVVNSVTKSGTNKLTGRLFDYFQDSSMTATDYFLKQRGEKNPESGSNVYGGSVGGPIVKNKLFYFFNYEGTNASEAANLSFPAAAAPLAVSYSTTTKFHGPNTFMRFDYNLNGNNQISFRWTREAIITENDSIEDDLAILQSVGPTSGYVAVLVFCQYISTGVASSLYNRPMFLWLMCPVLLYWITRVWVLARRRVLTDDPVVFAIKDPVSWICGAVVLLLAIAAAV